MSTEAGDLPGVVWFTEEVTESGWRVLELGTLVCSLDKLDVLLNKLSEIPMDSNAVENLLIAEGYYEKDSLETQIGCRHRIFCRSKSD